MLIAMKKPCLVLAGGLGSSKYVQSKLRTQYDPHGMRLLVERNPVEPYVLTHLCRQYITYKLVDLSQSAEALSSIGFSASCTALQSSAHAALVHHMV
jgi:hypothetical protein